MKKQNLKYLAACAALLSSTSAFAGATGNVGVFSEYMFRGVPQTGGAAVQGGLDYAHDSGWYIGTWGSNVGFAGGTEVDVYTGFTFSAGAVNFDLGALYYWYPEEDEVGTSPSINTIEVYAGAGTGPVTVKGYFTNDYFGSDESAYYVTAALGLPITDSFNFNVNVGFNAGDGVELLFGEEYFDYGLGVSKTIDGGYTASFSFIGTDLDAGGVDDDPKFVIGLKKTFDLM